MGHFAKVVDGKVSQVIVAEQEFFNTFVDSSPGQWLRTSYNMRGGVHYEPNSDTPRADQSQALRKNYAGIGCTYDPIADHFYGPSPYASWTLNDDAQWEAPIAYPTDGETYTWNEDTQEWDLVTTEGA